eukprot:2318926-Pyramimonas_sp.AAC.1
MVLPSSAEEAQRNHVKAVRFEFRAVTEPSRCDFGRPSGAVEFLLAASPGPLREMLYSRPLTPRDDTVQKRCVSHVLLHCF